MTKVNFMPKLSLLTKTESQFSPTFTDVSTSPPAIYVSSTEALMSQNSDVKPSQSPLLPRIKQLKESVSLTSIQSSPQGKTDHQALQSQESEEKLQNFSLLTNEASQSSPTVTDISTSPSQPTEASTPQHLKSDAKSLRFPLLPSTKNLKKESTSLSRAQSPSKGRTDHQALQLHESEEKLLKSSLLIEGELQMSPTSRDVITSPLQSLVDGAFSTEALRPQKSDKPQSAKLLKGSSSLSDMEELNKEVYSFVANAFQLQNETYKSQSTLSDIFKRHCQKFENLSKPHPCKVPHKDKEDTKLLPESSQHQNESEPQRKKPLLPPRLKGITK